MSVTDEGAEVLHEFEKPRATVRAYITTFKGRRFAHVREFVEPRDHPGAPLIATRAGICVDVDDLDELELAVGALVRAVRGPAASASGRARGRQAG